MQPQNGAEYPQLQPAQVQLLVALAQVVAADVVAPPGVAHIGCRSCKVGLKVQHPPVLGGVTGKAQGIAVGTWAAVAGQDQRQPAVLCVVQIMVVVQRHQRVQPGHIAFFALLPVQPPKVHAFFFIGLVEHIKVGVPKGIVAAPERNILLGFRVQPHRLSHGRVRILKGAHSVRRVQVDGGVQPHLVQILQKGLVVREQFRIPGIACPAVFALIVGAKAFVGVRPVPVHIHGGYRQRHIFRRKTLHQP